MRYSLIILLQIVLFSIAWAENYLWPTNASCAISATFGEFREGHYHSGIDIKTWGQSGYNVYAIDNGYIWKMRCSNRGYGRVIYQVLSNGRIAVYAHLERFSNLFEEMFQRFQAEEGRFRIEKEFLPDEFPVRKGQIIGYTGDTGTAVSHLHFEIRDQDGTPIDPLEFFTISSDRTIPLALQLNLVPLSTNSQINMMPIPRSVPLIYRGKKTYVTPDTIQVWGKIGVELLAFDKIRGFNNRYGLKSVRMFLNDSLLYERVANRIPFQLSSNIKVEFDPIKVRDRTEQFLKLYLPLKEINFPPVLRTIPYLQFSDTSYNLLKIELQDNNGNQATIQTTLFSYQPETIRLSLQNRSDSACVNITTGNLTQKPKVNLTGFSRFGYRLPLPPMDEAAKGNRVKQFCFDFREFSGDILEIRVRNPGGFWYPPYYLAVNNGQTSTSYITMDQDLNCRYFWLKKAGLNYYFQIFTRNLITNPPMLRLIRADTTFYIKTFHSSPRELVSELLRPEDLKGILSIEFELSGSPTTTCIKEPGFFYVNPKQPTRIISSDGSCELFIESEALFYPAVLGLEKSRTLQYFQNNRDLSLHSQIIHIYPEKIPFKRSLLLSFKIDPFLKRKDKLALYKLNPKNGNWNFLESTVDSLLNLVSARINSPGRFAVLQDTIPPTISPHIPDQGGSYYSQDLKKIVGIIEDRGSGVDDNSLYLILDGKTLYPEYHFIKKEYRYYLLDTLNPGEHDLEIIVIDNSGNRSQKRITFNIKP